MASVLRREFSFLEISNFSVQPQQASPFFFSLVLWEELNFQGANEAVEEEGQYLSLRQAACRTGTALESTSKRSGKKGVKSTPRSLLFLSPSAAALACAHCQKEVSRPAFSAEEEGRGSCIAPCLQQNILCCSGL